MSLTSPVPDSQGIAFTAVGMTCFYCHAVVEGDPAVHWMGAEGSTYLHPVCVVELTIRLFRDLHEIRVAGARRR